MRSILLVTFFIWFLGLTCISPVWADNKLVSVTKQDRSGGGYEIFAANIDIVPYWLIVKFTKLENLTASKKLPLEILLPPKTRSLPLLHLVPKSRGDYKIGYTYRYQIGNPEARHDDAHVYYFPFAHGSKRKLSQGYNGQATHYGMSRYSVDFEMPVGTPVFAARNGLVIKVVSRHNRGGRGSGYDNYANYIQVYHADGTIASYSHLKKNGVLVKRGQQVQRGQHIGYSGNTGNSSGPHLHFHVAKATRTGSMQTLPVRFLNHEKKAIHPQEGRFYYATHQGKESFTVVLGSQIRHEDYADHLQTIAITDKVAIRKEEIDNTVLFFIRNGKKHAITLELKLNLKNMQVSQTGEPRYFMQPGKEKFIFFLRPISGQTYKYSYKYSYKKAR